MSLASGHPRAFPSARQPASPVSRAQIEKVSARAVAGFGLVFGAQTLPALMSEWSSLRQPWALVVAIGLFAGLLVVAIAAAVKVLVTPAMLYVAIGYLIAVVAWPATTVDPSATAAEKPWLWYLCSVATAYAAIALPLWWAAAYTVLAPVAYGIVRMLPSGGGAHWELAALDTAYAIIVGGVVLVILTMLRQAASAVDHAQTAALQKYATAVRQHATEVERAQVDAIVHDSVLTTLLAAASPLTAKTAALVADMAKNAIGHLDAADDSRSTALSNVPLERLSARIQSVTAVLPVLFTVTVRELENRSVPEYAAEAIYSATVQAMMNSMQHAGGPEVRRELRLVGGTGGTGGTGATGAVTVEVVDTGTGFDHCAVPPERLGLRVSIVDRVTQVGGVVTVHSRPGMGTTIRMDWPAT